MIVNIIELQKLVALIISFYSELLKPKNNTDTLITITIGRQKITLSYFT